MTGTAPSSYRANVWLSYHQVQIRDANELGPQLPERWDNGLIAVADEPDGATILTGISIGAVDVTVQLAEGPPPLDLDSWEEIVEVSIESTSGSLIVCGSTETSLNCRTSPDRGWASTGFGYTREGVTPTRTARPAPPRLSTI
ncbi:hypothetical protein [Nonomuraea sp. NPDC049158]|uniref:hypothetical protein n=1 Tax=Nonomuraea sp. NPDC049158 TaxID=3155649 RepID=UPI0033CDAE18